MLRVLRDKLVRSELESSDTVSNVQEKDDSIRQLVHGEWWLDPTEGKSRMRRKLWFVQHESIEAQFTQTILGIESNHVLVSKSSSRLLLEVRTHSGLNDRPTNSTPSRNDTTHSIFDQVRESKDSTQTVKSNLPTVEEHLSTDDDYVDDDGQNEFETDSMIHLDGTSKRTDYDSVDYDEKDDWVDAEDQVVDEKLRPLLEPRDEIENALNCERVQGFDSTPGLFLLCAHHFYVVDNYQMAEDGSGTLFEVFPATENSFGLESKNESGLDTLTEGDEDEDTDQVPQSRAHSRRHSDFDSVSATKIMQLVNLDSKMQAPTIRHTCRKAAYVDVVEVHLRRYMLRHVALEIFSCDGRTRLVVFETRELRDKVYTWLCQRCSNMPGGGFSIGSLTLPLTRASELYNRIKKTFAG